VCRGSSYGGIFLFFRLWALVLFSSVATRLLSDLLALEKNYMLNLKDADIYTFHDLLHFHLYYNQYFVFVQAYNFTVLLQLSYFSHGEVKHDCVRKWLGRFVVVCNASPTPVLHFKEYWIWYNYYFYVNLSCICKNYTFEKEYQKLLSLF